MLRESGQASGDDYHLEAVNGGRGDGGVIEGAALVGFAEAVLAGDAVAIRTARNAVMAALGPAALGPAAMVDAAAVIAQFNAIDRVADATGTPLEPAKAEASADIRPVLGIDDYPGAEGKIRGC